MNAGPGPDRDVDVLDGPSEAQMLDVLYEVLAQGVPPRSSLTREDVEQFLHEHARVRKSRAEMLRFFSYHRLPLEPSAYGADPELGELALGLQKERGSVPPPPSAPPSVRPSEAVSVSPPPRAFVPDHTPEEWEEEPTAPRFHRRSEPPSRNGVNTLTLVLFALIVVGLLAALRYMYVRATFYEQALARTEAHYSGARSHSAATERRVEELQRALDESERERRAIAARLEGLLIEDARRRAIEQQVLERVLGRPRYRLIQKHLARAGAAGR